MRGVRLLVVDAVVEVDVLDLLELGSGIEGFGAVAVARAVGHVAESAGHGCGFEGGRC